MGALGEPFPSPVAPHPPPRRQRPGSGDWPPPASRGSSGAAQPEQEGKGRRGPGRRRKAAAAAASPAGWLAVTEIGRTGSGGGRRGLARLGSAQRSWVVCVRECVCVCVCTKPGPGNCPRAVLGSTRPNPPGPPASPPPRSVSATEGVGNRRGRGRASARLSLQPRGGLTSSKGEGEVRKLALQSIWTQAGRNRGTAS
ncbi:Wilms tumor protein 1-interacting protein-like [Passer montanus]|uniref:Wilms tumor protein 1-interacting protein-like n=1 Tax=Passer montanus TaxID=9160 RepID=UPI00195FC7BB|nr:Wilms tumor protein 1-interacting protein-like [Passer montanus]